MADVDEGSGIEIDIDEYARAVAIVLLGMAYADGEVSPEEAVDIAAFLEGTFEAVGVDPEDLEEDSVELLSALIEELNAMTEEDYAHRVEAAIETVKRVFPDKKVLRTIYRLVRDVARADQDGLSPDEREYLQHLQDYWKH